MQHSAQAIYFMFSCFYIEKTCPKPVVLRATDDSLEACAGKKENEICEVTCVDNAAVVGENPVCEDGTYTTSTRCGMCSLSLRTNHDHMNILIMRCI